MTDRNTDLRLAICAKRFDLLKWYFVGSDGKVDFGCGDWGSVLQRSQWGKVGNCFWHLNFSEMEGKYRWGVEEGKSNHESSPNNWKHQITKANFK